MRLVPITYDDEDLVVRLECDPEMMLHIGGPRQEIIPVLRISGVQDHRRLSMLAQNSWHCFQAIHFWHHDVEYHQVGVPVLEYS